MGGMLAQRPRPAPTRCSGSAGVSRPARSRPRRAPPPLRPDRARGGRRSPRAAPASTFTALSSRKRTRAGSTGSRGGDGVEDARIGLDQTRARRRGSGSRTGLVSGRAFVVGLPLAAVHVGEEGDGHLGPHPRDQDVGAGEGTLGPGGERGPGSRPGTGPAPTPRPDPPRTPRACSPALEGLHPAGSPANGSRAPRRCRCRSAPASGRRRPARSAPRPGRRAPDRRLALPRAMILRAARRTFRDTLLSGGRPSGRRTRSSTRQRGKGGPREAVHDVELRRRVRGVGPPGGRAREGRARRRLGGRGLQLRRPELHGLPGRQDRAGRDRLGHPAHLQPHADADRHDGGRRRRHLGWPLHPRSRAPRGPR